MSERWTPDSWRTRPVLQMPDYPNANCALLVAAERCHNIRTRGIDANELRLAW